MENDHIHDVFAALGPVTVKRMFGGKGIYHRGVIVAIEQDGEVLLKADTQSAPDFAAAGARQWSYMAKNKPVYLPYWTIPDAALDDPDELAVWTRKAFEAAVRSGK